MFDPGSGSKFSPKLPPPPPPPPPKPAAPAKAPAASTPSPAPQSAPAPSSSSSPAASSFKPPALRPPVVLSPPPPPPVSTMATTLRTERLGDGDANCLERAYNLAEPGDQVVLFQDSRDGVGHSVVRHQDGTVTDPNQPEVTYPNLQAWQASHPGYSNPVLVSQETLSHVLSLPPGPVRDSALRAAGLDGVADRPVADPDYSALVGLKKGSTDAANVEILQRRLIDLGVTTPEEQQAFEGNFGSFGDTTKRVLQRFQESQGLTPTGVVDEATAAALANPADPVDLVGPELRETQERVRQQAEQAVLSRVSPELMRLLPPEDQAAIHEEARQAGNEAVARFNNDLRGLVDEELAQRGLSREDLRNLPQEDRDAILAVPTLAALNRVNLGLDALETSAAQMDPDTATLVNPNNRLSVQDDETAWNDYCLAFVSGSYGFDVPAFTTPGRNSAILVADHGLANGTIATDRNYEDWPAGTVVFFDDTTANGGQGHIAIFTGRFTADGDPIIRTSGWGDGDGRNGITEMPLSELEDVSGAYLGNIRYPDPLEAPYGG